MWIRFDEEELKLVIAALMPVGPLADSLTARLTEELNQPEDERVETELYLEVANETYGREGELEFDEDAAVSLGDDPGAYVMCWRWVSEDTADAWAKTKAA